MKPISFVNIVLNEGQSPAGTIYFKLKQNQFLNNGVVSFNCGDKTTQVCVAIEPSERIIEIGLGKVGGDKPICNARFVIPKDISLNMPYSFSVQFDFWEVLEVECNSKKLRQAHTLESAKRKFTRLFGERFVVENKNFLRIEEYLKDEDEFSANFECSRLRFFEHQLDNIKEYDEEVFKRVVRKLKSDDSFGNLNFEGVRFEINILSCLYERGVKFETNIAKTQPPDFIIDFKGKGINAECTSKRIDESKALEWLELSKKYYGKEYPEGEKPIDLKRKIGEAFDIKNKKALYNKSSLLLIDINNLVYNRSINKNDFSHEEIELYVKEQLKQSYFGAALLFFYAHTHTISDSIYIRVDCDDIEDVLKCFLDKYFEFGTYDYEEGAVYLPEG